MAHRYGEAILVRRAPAARPAARPTDNSAENSAENLANSATVAVGGESASAPARFAWRGVWYQVDAILATWRLRDRWWAGGAPGAISRPVADVAEDAGVEGVAGMDGVTHMDGWGAPQADVLPPTERVYYRVLCRDPDGIQVFDLYFDAASGQGGQWVLDRAHD